MHPFVTKFVKYKIRTILDENPDTGQKKVFLQLWDWLGGFPTTFVFDQNAKMGDSCESWAETGLLAYSCTSIYTFLTFL